MCSYVKIYLEDELKKILSYDLNLNYFYYFYSYRYCKKPTSHRVLLRKRSRQTMFRALFQALPSFKGEKYSPR